MKHITVNVAPAASAKATLLIPRGLDDGHERPRTLECLNVTHQSELTADYGDQPGLELWPENPGEPVHIRYGFELSSHPLPESLWQPQNNRYTRASEGLIEETRSQIDRSAPLQTQIRQLIDKAATLFSYGHSEQRFNDGAETVPSLCGTTRGSCVDINTYLLASANALGIPVQYVAGYWFHPDRNVTHDLHCWLVFKTEEQIIYWDVAHHLKWGVSPLRPGLNPAGGRRVAMSYGRGLNFQTSQGRFTISHFSEPVWLHPDGTMERPLLTITIEEPAG